MLRLVSDENFRGAIVRGLLQRQPDLDLVRVQDVGLQGADDRDILAWAATEGRILLTHDRQTMPGFAYSRVRAGEAMSGVFVVDNQLPTGQAIDEILLRALCSEPAEWKNLVEFVP